MAIPTKNKYGARKLTAPDGQKFDSVKEYHRWGCLRLLERAGKITDLKRQVKYVLIPAQRDENGKLLEREVSYVADFKYFDNSLGEEVVEDVKGYKGGSAYNIFSIKRKLMLFCHGIVVKEV